MRSTYYKWSRDVVRTRIYLTNQADWQAVARSHAEFFGEIRSTNTLVVAALIGDEYLVEIEAEAYLSQANSRGGTPLDVSPMERADALHNVHNTQSFSHHNLFET